MARTSRNKPGVSLEVVDNTGEEVLKDVRHSFEKNKKTIIGVVAAVVIAVGGFFGYKYFVAEPKEESATTALFPSQRWFEKDSFNYVLNGDGQSSGALQVASKYGSTKAGNLANYYVGVSYLKTGDFANAITFLEKFDGKGTPLQYLAHGALGDAYAESENHQKAIQNYSKAASNKDDKFVSPIYLFRAGLLSERNGNKEEALKYYQQIKDNYPFSQQGRDIDKYLARLGQPPIN